MYYFLFNIKKFIRSFDEVQNKTGRESALGMKCYYSKRNLLTYSNSLFYRCGRIDLLTLAGQSLPAGTPDFAPLGKQMEIAITSILLLLE